MTVTYTQHLVWNRSASGAPQLNRPYAEVVLTGPKRSVRLWCLVDSGADYIQLNQTVATKAGITSFDSTQSVSTAAGGTTTLQVLDNADLSVEGTGLIDTCFFGSNTIPILGRITFLNAFTDVGFDAKGWMYA